MKKQQAVRLSKARAKHSDAMGNGNSQFGSLMRLMTRAPGKAVHFEITAERGSRVFVAGTFNNWDPTAHPLNHDPDAGVFRVTLHLAAGAHEYKFVVNGVWHMDDKCPHWVPNAHGSLNSVIHV